MTEASPLHPSISVAYPLGDGLSPGEFFNANCLVKCLDVLLCSAFVPALASS